jgi:hypothetical protein
MVELPERRDKLAPKAVDKQAQQSESWQTFLSRQFVRHRLKLTELYQAYEEATGTCIGCD